MKKVIKCIIAILLAVAGVASVMFVYTGHFSPMLEENKKLEQQIAVYEQNIAGLRDHKLNEDKYKTEIEAIQKDLEGLFEQFPVELRYEDELLYIDYLEDKLGFPISTLNVGADYSIYNMADGRALCAQYVTIPYETTYQGLKEMITFFNSDDDKTDDEYPASIVNVTVSFNNSDGSVSGNLILRRYYVMGVGSYLPPQIPDTMFPVGDDNIFN